MEVYVSKVLTGIYGNPLGKTGGVVWGAARTEYGKVATTREWVIPTDPDTADQQEQRGKFLVCVNCARNVGSAIWRDPWNNVDGELPGYHCWMGWMLDNMTYAGGIYVWPAAPTAKALGPSYQPGITAAAGGSGEIDITWDETIVGDDTALTDDVMAVTLYGDDPDLVSGMDLVTPGSYTRDDEGYTITGLVPGEDYTTTLWFRHDPGGGDPYIYSATSSDQATAGT
jgi:hypothetical protein